MHALDYEEYIELSIQEILDCNTRDKGCKGGLPSNVAEYIKRFGVSAEENYPYEAKKKICRSPYMQGRAKMMRNNKRFLQTLDTKPNTNYGKSLQSEELEKKMKIKIRYDTVYQKYYKEVKTQDEKIFFFSMDNKPFTPSTPIGLLLKSNYPRWLTKENKTPKNKYIKKKKVGPDFRYTKLKGFAFINESVLDMIEALQFGPVVTTFHVPSSFKFYNTGVYSTNMCKGKSKYSVNHSVVVIGYNLNAKDPYFEAKNSWGKRWGDDGYFKIKIGKLSRRNKGLCFFAGTPFIIMPFLQ